SRRSVRRCSPLCRSHSAIDPSSPQLASVLPSGLTLSACTVPLCASCTRTHSPLCTSHQRSLPSLPPLTTRSPLGTQFSVETTPGCPAKACTHSPLWASHTKSSPPSLPPLPEASRVPSGLQATLVTMPTAGDRKSTRLNSSHSQI